MPLCEIFVITSQYSTRKNVPNVLLYFHEKMEVIIINQCTCFFRLPW